MLPRNYPRPLWLLGPAEEMFSTYDTMGYMATLWTLNDFLDTAWLANNGPNPALWSRYFVGLHCECWSPGEPVWIADMIMFDNCLEFWLGQEGNMTIGDFLSDDDACAEQRFQVKLYKLDY